MVVVDFFREFAYGLKLGARHTVTQRHDLTERALRPGLPKVARNAVLGAEEFGR